MAFLKRKAAKPVEDFISSHDSAIDSDKTDLEAYRETWDPEKLVLLEGQAPSIFKVRMELPRKVNTEVKNASIGLDKKGRAKFALGDHEFELVRSALVGIENPPDTPADQCFQFTKGGDGLVSDALMEELNHSGVVEEIYAFYHSKKKGRDELLKKK